MIFRRSCLSWRARSSWYFASFLFLMTGQVDFGWSGRVVASQVPTSLTVELVQDRELAPSIGQLFRDGNRLFQAHQYQEALAVYESASQLSTEATPSIMMGNILANAATAARILGQLDRAQNYVNRAMAIAEELDNLELLSHSLNESGVIAYNRSQFDVALERYQHALAVSQDISHRPVEVHILDNMGVVYRQQGEYDTALNFHQQALALSQSLSDTTIQARILNNIGIVYSLYGNYSESLSFNLRALALAQQHQNRLVEGRILSSIGVTYLDLGDYPQAQEFFQQALSVAQTIGNRAESGRILNNIGTLLMRQGDYLPAIEQLEDAVAIQQQIDNAIDEATSYGNLGLAYWNLGEYSRASQYYNQALAIQQTVGDRPGEGYTLASQGGVLFSTGNYAQSLASFEQSLQIFQQIGALAEAANTLNSIGGVYQSLGQLPQALEYYQQALAIRQDIGDRTGMGISFNNIGLVYSLQGNQSEALAAFQQALTIRQEIRDRAGEAATLNSLGSLYAQLNQPAQAITASEQALAIYREISNPVGEAQALTNLGANYRILAQDKQALQTFQTALGLFQVSGNREGERFILGRIGDLLAQYGETELAIVFYKQAVNLTESIRQELQSLSLDVQQTYIDTVADTYRQLADLLLQEDRVLEAQQVLDLLKVQELDDYLRDVRSINPSQRGIDLLDPEAEISNRAIAIGRELAALREMPVAELSPDQQQRLAELDAAQRAIRQDFQQFIETPEVQALIAQLDTDARQQDVLAELDEFINLQNNLRQINQNAVLIYPLILDERLELVLVTPFSEPTRYPVNTVGRTELNQAIISFRQTLTDPTHPPQAVRQLAQQLYEWLIAPMAHDLEAVGAETILYAPDGVLRYVPLAALHDGRQWLIERFRINHITATSLQDFALQPPSQFRILAAAFSEGAFDVSVDNLTFSLAGLPFAGVEIENLAAAFPETTTLFNEAFNRSVTEPIMDSHTIVHLATHAAFVPGSPDQSFILFGNGELLTLAEIRDEWQGRFNQVDLIVLSACETGLGGPTLGSGEEILGFGYLMQEAGAEAAIATLWSVSDGGTQVLMNEFYNALNQGMGKAEALQLAQSALVTGEFTAVGNTRGDDGRIVAISTATGLPTSVSNNLDHPYYWAPFILIGNGL